LLAGGAAIGLLWETYNYWARGKWVYTVPWLEDLKLFEMPPFGFVGFPFFALEAWAMYHALCAAGAAIPLDHPATTRVRRATVAGLLALGLSWAVLRGMERRTISSVVPRLEDVPGVAGAAATVLRANGIPTPFALAQSGDGPLEEAARLTVLRGIGGEHAYWLGVVGISSVCDLAGRDPGDLWRALQPITRGTEPRPTPAEVRVWQRAAARDCPEGT
jgi:hypothetical protein